MIISPTENTELHQLLFENWENYDRWAPFFYEEFVKVKSIENGRWVGVMTPAMVNVHDSVADAFMLWLKSKGIIVQ